MRLHSRHRLPVVLIGAAVVLVGSAAAILAFVDEEEDGYTREMIAAGCTGVNQPTVSGHYDLDPESDGYTTTSQEAFSAGLPSILPLANAAAFQNVTTGVGAQGASADSGPPRLETYEMRSVTGALLARVDVRRFEGKGYAISSWQACANLTGGTGVGPPNYSYDPNASTEE